MGIVVKLMDRLQEDDAASSSHQDISSLLHAVGQLGVERLQVRDEMTMIVPLKIDMLEVCWFAV